MQKIFVTTLGPTYSRATVSLVNDQSKKDMGFVGFLTITDVHLWVSSFAVGDQGRFSWRHYEMLCSWTPSKVFTYINFHDTRTLLGAICPDPFILRSDLVLTATQDRQNISRLGTVLE